MALLTISSLVYLGYFNIEKKIRNITSIGRYLGLYVNFLILLLPSSVSPSPPPFPPPSSPKNGRNKSNILENGEHSALGYKFEHLLPPQSSSFTKLWLRSFEATHSPRIKFYSRFIWKKPDQNYWCSPERKGVCLKVAHFEPDNNSPQGRVQTC